jgi:CDP-diacylglycerol--serine O-phosphatidyltransferase
VAPGLILYQLLRISYMQEENGLDISAWALMPALIFPCAGAWRLARFNVQSSGENDFNGLPIPAAGLVVASLPLILFYNNLNVDVLLLNKWALYAIIILLSCLMVSNIRFMGMKFSDTSVKSNFPKVILAVAAIIAAVLLQWLAVPVVFIIYIIISLTAKKQFK